MTSKQGSVTAGVASQVALQLAHILPLDRVRDLVDLQLLDKREELDLGQLRATCLRLFYYRQLHSWPPSVEVGVGWDELYEAAIEGVDVLLEVGDAVAWANGLITRIAEA